MNIFLRRKTTREGTLPIRGPSHVKLSTIYISGTVYPRLAMEGVLRASTLMLHEY